MSNEFFTVFLWTLSGEVKFQQAYPYTLVSVIKGKGEIIIGGSSFPIELGDHFILLNNIKEWTINGEVT